MTALEIQAVDGSGLKNLIMAVSFFFVDSSTLILCDIHHCSIFCNQMNNQCSPVGFRHIIIDSR
jgi:hypothetical protein